MRWTWVAAVGAVAALVAALVVFGSPADAEPRSASPKPASETATETASDAESEAASEAPEFVPRKPEAFSANPNLRLSVEPLTSGGGLRELVDPATGDTFSISEATGVVVIYGRPAAYSIPHFAGSVLTRDEALAKARAYVAKVLGPRIGEYREKVSWQPDRGEFRIEMRRYQDGVSTFDYINVMCRTDNGEVKMVTADEGVVSVDLKPTFSLERALVKAKGDASRERVTRAELQVTMSPEGEQNLAYWIEWTVPLRDGFVGTHTKCIDAHDGELLHDSYLGVTTF